MQRVKEFDKSLLKIELARIRGVYLLWLLILVLLIFFSPITNIVQQLDTERFYIKTIIFRGIFIFLSTKAYMKSYVYIQRLDRKNSIYQKLKYCPINKNDLIKNRFIYLAKYIFTISIVLSFINLLNIFLDGTLKANIIQGSIILAIVFILVNSFVYFILLGFIFGFLPIGICLILESMDKIIRNKYIDYIFKIVIFLIIVKCFIFLWGICFNQKFYYSLSNGGTITRNAFIDKKEESITSFISNIDKLPNYKNISYQNHDTLALFFCSKATSLIVDYDEKNYYKEKNNLEKEYIFAKGKNALPKNKFYVGKYNFRVVQKYKDRESYFPKNFGIVGTSDDKKSIAYLSFIDIDLDNIDNMEQFVKDYFKCDFE